MPAALGGSIGSVDRLSHPLVGSTARVGNRGRDGRRQGPAARQGGRHGERAGGAAAQSLVDLGADLRRERSPAAQPPQRRHVQAGLLKQQLLYEQHRTVTPQ